MEYERYDKTKDKDYIRFGDYCLGTLNMQCQTGYYYFEGLAGHPELGTGLRVKGDDWNYHSLFIHKDDAVTFKDRLNMHYLECGCDDLIIP